jgi:hypothetical protein
MEITERGCVYFFRHIGLSPVKIGYSTNESPINRFESFKTYAPYGSELLGFIITKESKELETILHKRFSANRLKGEWFEISKEDVKKVVSFYSNIEDIKEKNEFEIAWARSFSKSIDKKLNLESCLAEFSKYFSFDFLENTDVCFKNQTEISEILKFNKKTIAEMFSKNEIKLHTYRVNGSVKKAYKLYEKSKQND